MLEPRLAHSSCQCHLSTLRGDDIFEEVSTSSQPSLRLSQLMLHPLWPPQMPSRSSRLVYEETKFNV